MSLGQHRCGTDAADGGMRVLLLRLLWGWYSGNGRHRLQLLRTSPGGAMTLTADGGQFAHDALAALKIVRVRVTPSYCS
jgi:hypothetical protein